MTAPNYPQMAALVLGKCAAYDAYLAEPSEETCLAWAEQFALHALELPDLMAAVTKVYSEHGSGYRPLPKDFTDAARAIRAERGQRESATDRRAREDRRDRALEVARESCAHLKSVLQPDVRQRDVQAAVGGFGKAIPDA